MYSTRIKHLFLIILLNVYNCYVLNNYRTVNSIDEAIKVDSDYKHLDLSGKGLAQLPVDSYKLKEVWVSTLDLRDNNLSDINTEICWFEKLIYLYLDNNRIEKLPKADCSNKEIYINTVSLKNNNIKKIDDTMGSLRVSHLDLSHNQISTVSNNFFINSQKIKKLILTGNPLSEAEIEKVRKALPNAEVVF